MKLVFAMLILTLSLAGCSTATYMKLPDNTEIVIKRGNNPTYSGPFIERRPFPWSSVAGIPYALKQDGKVIKEGKLPARFRPAAIFWPPVALAYWPVGFGQKCLDLTIEPPYLCTREVYRELKRQRKYGR